MPKKKFKKSRSRSTLLRPDSALPSRQKESPVVSKLKANETEQPKLSSSNPSPNSTFRPQQSVSKGSGNKTPTEDSSSHIAASSSSSYPASPSHSSPAARASPVGASPNTRASANDPQPLGHPSSNEANEEINKPPQTSPPPDFSSLWLAEVTKEFADDIEKLRHAPDFKGQQCVEMLVEALRQGENLYTDEEKRVMMQYCS